jgi:integrase
LPRETQENPYKLALVLVVFTAFIISCTTSPLLTLRDHMTKSPGERQRRRQRRLTDKIIAKLPREASRYIVSDAGWRGLFVRVPTKGPVVFAAICRDPFGQQRLTTLGPATELTLAQAREMARVANQRVREGKPAFEPVKPKPESFGTVSANWLTRHVAGKKMRTGREMGRIIERYILPYWKDNDFVGIRRSDIVSLLDVIEDKHGPAMADATLTVLRSIASWVQSRNDDYTPPFGKNMRRVPKEDRQRERVLSDDELRRIWDAAAEAGQFGGFVKLLLLTAQRREKVITMRWDDVSSDGVWTIPRELREKGNALALQLPDLALNVIRAQARYVGNPYVFASPRNDKPIAITSALKAKLDAQCGVNGWVLHDLRRTARSLMSRAGVLSEHAERCLGHAIGGVEGVYDRHSYFAEKTDALRKLAALVELIVNPPSDNVVPLRGEAVS